VKRSQDSWHEFGDQSEEQAAFAIAPVRGARAFEIADGGWLAGCTYKYKWVPGENVARCVRQTQYTERIQRQMHGDNQPYIADRDIPDHTIGNCTSGNGHGLYGYYDGSNTYRSTNRIEAVIEGYGRVVLGNRGFRAERAEIIAIAAPPEVIQYRKESFEEVKRRYSGIPIFDSFEEMVLWFPPDTGESWGNNR
jgi:hypothetical protein